jgi:uroporphyrinogen decarboxylase
MFVRRLNGRLDLLEDSGADAVSLDWTVEMDRARKQLGETPVQGNLDPSYLFGDPEFVEEKTRSLIETAGQSGHILNLGHGVDKDTPVESVEMFVETAKSFSWESQTS